MNTSTVFFQNFTTSLKFGLSQMVIKSDHLLHHKICSIFDLTERVLIAKQAPRTGKHLFTFLFSYNIHQVHKYYMYKSKTFLNVRTHTHIHTHIHACVRAPRQDLKHL